MKIYGAKVAEGSDIINLTVDNGASFPSLPNAGELFYKTGSGAGLYVHDGSTWHLQADTAYADTAANSPITLSGAVTGTGSSSITTVLADSGIAAGTYTKLTVNTKGIATSGTALGGSDVTGALGYTPVNKAGDTMTGELTTAGLHTSGIITAGNSNQALIHGFTISGVHYARLRAEPDSWASPFADLTLGTDGTLTFNGQSVWHAGNFTPSSKQDALGFTPVNKAGDTMTGALVLNGNPTLTNHASNKGYVDSVFTRASQSDIISALGFTPLNKAGDTTLGYLSLNADPVSAMHAATKQYVDATTSNLDIKASCRAATTANIALSGLQTIDGYALQAGDRVLVKNQSNAVENGMYVAASGSWARTSDFDGSPSTETSSGAFTFIERGTVNASVGYVLITPDPITIGSTALTFTQFSNSGAIVAGAGLTKSGNQLDILSGSTSRIVVSSDSIDLATTGIVAGTYTRLTVDAYGRATAGTSILSSDITTALGYTPVNKAGDTVTGALAVGTTVTNADTLVAITPSSAGFAITIKSRASDNMGSLRFVNSGYTAETGSIYNTAGQMYITASVNDLKFNGQSVYHTGNFTPSSKQDVLGYTPVQQGTGTGQSGNVVKIGWSSGGRLKATVDSTDLGTFIFDGNAGSVLTSYLYLDAQSDGYSVISFRNYAKTQKAHLFLAPAGSVYLSTAIDGTRKDWVFNTTGDFTAPGNIGTAGSIQSGSFRSVYAAASTHSGVYYFGTSDNYIYKTGGTFQFTVNNNGAGAAGANAYLGGTGEIVTSSTLASSSYPITTTGTVTSRGGRAPALNPTTPLDGDISVSGGVIYIYANGGYRQIYPAVYS